MVAAKSSTLLEPKGKMLRKGTATNRTIKDNGAQPQVLRVLRGRGTAVGVNHWERDCRKKKAGEPRKTPAPEANLAQKRDKPSPSVLWSQALSNDDCPRKTQHKASGSRAADVLTICLLTSGTVNSSWYIDSGASAHVCKDRAEFKTYSPRTDFDHVVLGDNTHLEVKGAGQVQIRLADDEWIVLHGVLHVPTMSKNLLSVRQLTRQPDITLQFENDVCNISINGIVKARGRLRDDLYALVSGRKNDMAMATTVGSATSLPTIWHARLGHPNRQKMQIMASGDYYRDKFTHDFAQLPFCEVCVRAK